MLQLLNATKISMPAAIIAIATDTIKNLYDTIKTAVIKKAKAINANTEVIQSII